MKARVKSYFRVTDSLSPRIRLMVRQISDIEFIVTDSEPEALTLESNLIKDNQPYFNILLKAGTGTAVTATGQGLSMMVATDGTTVHNMKSEDTDTKIFSPFIDSFNKTGT